VSKLSYFQKQFLRGTNDPTQQEVPAQVEYTGTKFKLKIPLHTLPDEIGDFQCLTLVRKFGQQIMTIYNGLLSGKRIIFLGFNISSDEVCTYVLSAVSLVCPPLRNFVSRVFPYTNLTALEFLSVPGFVAGVANPMFEQHTEWWDILCDINKGKVTISGKGPGVDSGKEPHSMLDEELFGKLNDQVQGHYGEQGVRNVFTNYSQRIIDIAMSEEEFSDESRRKFETDCNRIRIENWKKTASYADYQEFLRQRRDISSIKDATVPRLIKKLRNRKHISEAEMIEMYSVFQKNVTTENQLVEFLSYLPESLGGVYPVAVSLFHTAESVRLQAARLLQHMDKIKTANNGQSFVTSLNPFLVLAYERIVRKL